MDRICCHRWEIRKGVQVDSQISGLDRFVGSGEPSLKYREQWGRKNSSKGGRGDQDLLGLRCLRDTPEEMLSGLLGLRVRREVLLTGNLLRVSHSPRRNGMRECGWLIKAPLF